MGRPRTRVVPGGGTDTYSYVGTSKDVSRIANTGGVIADSILDAGGARLGARVGTTVGWFLLDGLGNVVGAEAGAATTISDALRYDGYGQTVAAYSTTSGALSSDWKHQGRLDLDPAGGRPLYDAGARLYAPGLGAFLSIDSVIRSAKGALTARLR